MRVLRAKRRQESLLEKRVAWLANMETRRCNQDKGPNMTYVVVTGEYKCSDCTRFLALDSFDELKLCCKTCNGTVDLLPDTQLRIQLAASTIARVYIRSFVLKCCWYVAIYVYS